MKRWEVIEKELKKLGGPGSGHHGHRGTPGHRGGSASSVGGAVGVGGWNEELVRKYEMMRDASFVSEETAKRIMDKAMVSSDDLSAARKAKIVNGHAGVNKVYKKYPGLGVGMDKAHIITIPKSGSFAGMPLEVRGYARFQAGVTHWRMSPLDSKGRPLDLDVVIPKEELG